MVLEFRYRLKLAKDQQQVERVAVYLIYVKCAGFFLFER